MSNCPCGNELEYEKCCGIFHSGSKKPNTCEELMRARYTAFAKGEIKFIADSHMPETSDFNEADAKQWSESSTWEGLEIVSTKQGFDEHNTGIVEFRAMYSDTEKNKYIHHEIATFKKIDDSWHYDQGQIVGSGPITRSGPKVGRNDPCTCGSKKKYKKCCGKN